MPELSLRSVAVLGLGALDVALVVVASAATRGTPRVVTNTSTSVYDGTGTGLVGSGVTAGVHL